MAADPCEISFLYFLFYLKSGGGSYMRMVDANNGAQEEKLVGGTQQVSEGLGKFIGMEKIVSITYLLLLKFQLET